jgi:hypothetical protein
VVVGETEPQGAVEQETVQVTLTVAEGSLVTVGVMVVELPAFTGAVLGATEIVTALNVIVTVPTFVPSATDVAVIVTVTSLGGGLLGAV